MIGFSCMWSCPSCGKKFKDLPGMLFGDIIRLKSPTRCKCGRKEDFDFNSLIQVEYVKKGHSE